MKKVSKPKCAYHKLRNAKYQCYCGVKICEECKDYNEGECPEDQQEHHEISRI